MSICCCGKESNEPSQTVAASSAAGNIITKGLTGLAKLTPYGWAIESKMPEYMGKVIETCRNEWIWRLGWPTQPSFA